MRFAKGDEDYSEYLRERIRKLKALRQLHDDLLENYSVSKEEIEDAMSHPKLLEEEVPLSAFCNPNLSTLETLTKYLREEHKLPYKKIATLLGRGEGPIGITYRNSRRKMKTRLSLDSRVTIPLSIFSKDGYSVLESLVKYLKESVNMNYSMIARMINRDPRTIWTVYRRASLK